MAQLLSEDIIRNLTAKSNEPILFRQFIQNWSLCKWDVEKWVSIFGTKEVPFRCLKKSFISDEPCWERRCYIEKMTFRSFLDSLATSKKWMYFDYKYLHQWFSEDNELTQVRSYMLNIFSYNCVVYNLKALELLEVNSSESLC